MSGYCSLQASDAPSSERARCTWPSDAAAAGWCSKLSNFCRPVGAKLGHHPAFDEGPAHRRRFALQFLQFGGVFRRQQIGNGRHQLRDLHQRAFEPAERRGQRARFTGTVRFATHETPARRNAPRPRRHWRRPARTARRAPRSGFFRYRARFCFPASRSCPPTLMQRLWLTRELIGRRDRAAHRLTSKCGPHHAVTSQKTAFCGSGGCYGQFTPRFGHRLCHTCFGYRQRAGAC